MPASMREERALTRWEGHGSGMHQSAAAGCVGRVDQGSTLPNAASDAKRRRATSHAHHWLAASGVSNVMPESTMSLPAGDVHVSNGVRTLGSIQKCEPVPLTLNIGSPCTTTLVVGALMAGQWQVNGRQTLAHTIYIDLSCVHMSMLLVLEPRV